MSTVCYRKVLTQEAVVGMTSDRVVETADLERRLDKTGPGKKGIVQQRLTGRVRLATSPSSHYCGPIYPASNSSCDRTHFVCDTIPIDLELQCSILSKAMKYTKLRFVLNIRPVVTIIVENIVTMGFAFLRGCVENRPIALRRS